MKAWMKRKQRLQLKYGLDIVLRRSEEFDMIEIKIA